MRSLVILAAIALMIVPVVAQNTTDTKKVDADKLYNEPFNNRPEPGRNFRATLRYRF